MGERDDKRWNESRCLISATGHTHKYRGIEQIVSAGGGNIVPVS